MFNNQSPSLGSRQTNPISGVGPGTLHVNQHPGEFCSLTLENH